MSAAHRGIAHRLAEPGAPDAVEDGLGERGVDYDGGGGAADGKRVLHGDGVYGGGLGKRGVYHGRGSRGHPDDLEPAPCLGGGVAGDVEHGAASEGDDGVVDPDPRLDERRRHESGALQAVGLDLLSAGDHYGARGESYAVRLEILADLEPEPLGALHDVRVGDERDLGGPRAHDGLQRVRERRVLLREDVLGDFDWILALSLFSCHFPAVLQRVFLSRS